MNFWLRLGFKHARDTAWGSTLKLDLSPIAAAREAAESGEISWLLSHAEPIIRAWACQQLGRRSPAEAVPILVSTLYDPDATVRFAAEGSLVSIGTPAVDALIELLSGAEPARTYAVDALRKIEDNRAVSGLLKLLGSTISAEMSLRHKVLFALRSIPDIRALDSLMSTLGG